MYFDKIPDIEIKEYLSKNYPQAKFSENMIKSFNGSIGKALKINDKIELYTSLDTLASNIENKDILEIMKQAEIIYKSRENIIDILNYINILFFNEAKRNIKMTEYIKIVEDTKLRLNSNTNYDMTIDNMLFKISSVQ